MRRFLNRLMSKSRTTSTARREPHRASLQVEGLEDRTVLSTATQVGTALTVFVDPGFIVFGTRGLPGLTHIRQTTFQADKAHPSKLDVFDDGKLIGQFAISSIKSVNVSVSTLDAINIEDSNGMPFGSGTNVSLFGGTGFKNSLNLTGSRAISGAETYVGSTATQAASLSLAGVSIQFTSVINSVTDSVKTTSLVVKSFGHAITLSGDSGVTQTLTGLADFGGGSDSLTYSNKTLVNLEMFRFSAGATLNATARAAGEQFFVVDLFGANQGLTINATPSTVDTSVVDAGQGDAIFLLANSGRVFVNGTVSTFVELGSAAQNGVTAGIKRDVFVNGAGRLALFDLGNHTTQEHVTVTESTVSGTGLFGNNAVALHYSNVRDLEFGTGKLAATYTIVGSHPGARFGAEIDINDNSTVGMNVLVAIDAGSGLNMALLNQGLTTAPASLFILAPNGKFSVPTPTTPNGTEAVTFAGGLTSFLSWIGVNSVTHS